MAINGNAIKIVTGFFYYNLININLAYKKYY